MPSTKKQEQNMEEKHSQEEKSLYRTKIKIAIFNIINAALLVALVFMLQKFPSDAEKVKQLRSESVASEDENDIGVLHAELDRNREKISRISDVFVDEDKFLNFIASVDQMESQGLISNFNLPVTKPVMDSNKNLGLPVAMTFSGSVEQVNQAFSQVSALPFILRPVNIDMDISLEGQVVVRYGGFLYTDESFSSN